MKTGSPDSLLLSPDYLNHNGSSAAHPLRISIANAGT
jgi:hypothetical protein